MGEKRRKSKGQKIFLTVGLVVCVRVCVCFSQIETKARKNVHLKVLFDILLKFQPV